jgi:hypothetical protein
MPLDRRFAVTMSTSAYSLALFVAALAYRPAGCGPAGASLSSISVFQAPQSAH